MANPYPYYVVVSQILWICFACENVDDSKLKPKTGKSTGFDYGNKTFLTSDAGNKIESPQFFKQSLNTLRSLNKALSRKVKGSNNWYRAIRALERHHRKVARQREDWQWKLAITKNSLFLIGSGHAQNVVHTTTETSTLLSTSNGQLCCLKWSGCQTFPEKKAYREETQSLTFRLWVLLTNLTKMKICGIIYYQSCNATFNVGSI